MTEPMRVWAMEEVRGHRGISADDTLRTIPTSVDLRQSPGFPPIYHQGRLNSCTAHALSAVLLYDMHKRGVPEPFEPSRLFLYYNERRHAQLIGDSQFEKSGAPVRMRDCIRSIGATGFCADADWPYVEDHFDTEPPVHAYEFAKNHRGYTYRRLEQELGKLKSCLAEGYPFVCGIVVYQSFLSLQVRETGIIPIPGADEAIRGGHAIAVVGYDDSRQHFIARNSLGANWGDRGFCYISYDFLCNPQFGLDFWTIRSTEGAA